MTTKTLEIAKTLSLPRDAATQTFAFIARKGAGKTYTAGKLVELLIDAHVQVIVLDTVGNWYGLRLAADGKGAGFDVAVLGGLRGDIPLEASGGALIADIAVETGRSLVLDASQWSKADRQRFATAFGERLWLKKKREKHPTPVHLVLEESQLIVPQDVRGDTATMVGVYEEIIRLGRNYGIGVSMITQRPQSVNKEVLNQTECLFVGQINGAQERDALKKWITHQGMDVHLVDELPSLKVGTFYVWSPQWLNLLERVEILAKTTFDASATPKVGDKRVRRELKPLDLADLQEQLKATIEQQKANDPRELKKQVTDLKALLAKKEAFIAEVDERTKRIEANLTAKLTKADNSATKSANAELKAELVKYRRALEAAMKILVKVKAVDFAVDSDEGRKALEQAVAAAVRQVTSPIEKRVTGLVERVEGIKRAAGEAEKAIAALLEQKIDLTVHVEKREPFAVAADRPLRQPLHPRTDTGDSAVKGGKFREMLIALAQAGRPLSDRQVAARAVMSLSGTFDKYLGQQRTNGWVKGQRSGLSITQAGVDALGPFDPLPVGSELQQHWLNELGKGKRSEMLSVLIATYPNTVSDDEVAKRADMALSGTFDKYLGQLRTLQLVEGPRHELRASAELFD